MKILSLQLRNFRLFDHAAIPFAPGLNYFSGPNAAGKTTLLEALLLLCTGRSMRTRHLDQLVKEKQERFALSCHFERHGIEQQIDLFSDGKRHDLTINATRGHRLHALLGQCQGVVITPEDIQIIKGSPEERRRFIDQYLCTTYPLYVHHLHRYKRALKQRSACLKQNSFGTIALWEQQLAKSAAFIVQERATALERIEKQASPLLRQLSGGLEGLKLLYRLPKASDLEEHFIQELAESRGKDTLLQTTTVGPHRDDILVLINGKNARSFASEGQKKSLVCALRLAQWHQMGENETPFLGIDDIGACLDEERLSALIKEISHLGQVFVTSPTPSPLENAEIFAIESGVVKKFAEKIATSLV